MYLYAGNLANNWQIEGGTFTSFLVGIGTDALKRIVRESRAGGPVRFAARSCRRPAPRNNFHSEHLEISSIKNLSRVKTVSNTSTFTYLHLFALICICLHLFASVCTYRYLSAR